LDLNLLGSEIFAPENRFLFSILGTSVTNKKHQPGSLVDIPSLYYTLQQSNMAMENAPFNSG